MPTPRLPKSKESWASNYTSKGAEAIESAKIESGSNFTYESALRLRVLHNEKNIVVKSKETQWVEDLEIFPKAQQTAAKKAILGPHFEGLLQVVRRPGKWSANDFIKAGCFGPFLSLLSLIEHDNTGEETGGSAVTYYDNTPPVAARTRFQQAQRDNFTTPIRRVNYTTGDYFRSTTPASPEEPPSGQGSVARYEQAGVNVRDEQTVNQCLINLMLPITWPLDIFGNIDPQRQAFKFALDDQKGYEARVDGIVTSQTRRNDVVGILEVKRGRRTHEVRVQEVAQMAAFMRRLSAEQDNNDSVVKRRWLVSMCANELFITIATCKRPYLDFLETMPKWDGDVSKLEDDTFLHMTEYGPYKLRYYSPLVAALEHLYVLLSNA